MKPTRRYDLLASWVTNLDKVFCNPNFKPAKLMVVLSVVQG
jgi:hypothetical protein